MQLDQWSPIVGYFGDELAIGEVWVRVTTLSMHLWGKEFFNRLSDAYEGFMVVDEETVGSHHLQWAQNPP